MAGRRMFLKSISLAGIGFHIEKAEKFALKFFNKKAIRSPIFAELNDLSFSDSVLKKVFLSHLKLVCQFLSKNSGLKRGADVFDKNKLTECFEFAEHALTSWWQVYQLPTNKLAFQNLNSLIEDHAEAYCSLSNRFDPFLFAPDYSITLVLGWSFYKKSASKEAFRESWPDALDSYLNALSEKFDLNEAEPELENQVNYFNGENFRTADHILLMHGLESASKICAFLFPASTNSLRCINLRKKIASRLKKQFELMPGEWNYLQGGLFAEPSSVKSLAVVEFIQRASGFLLPGFGQLSWLNSDMNPYYSTGKVISGLVNGNIDLERIHVPSYILSSFAVEGHVVSSRIAVLRDASRLRNLPENIHRDDYNQQRENASMLSAGLFTALIFDLLDKSPHILLEKVG